MGKADDLREAFLAEFGEAATRTRTGALLGFDQPEPDPEAEAEPQSESA